MKVNIKIFPIAGLFNKKQELEIALENGDLNEALTRLQELLGVNFRENKTLMYLHNGYKLESQNDAVFQEGDQLWLLPILSGG